MKAKEESKRAPDNLSQVTVIFSKLVAKEWLKSALWLL